MNNIKLLLLTMSFLCVQLEANAGLITNGSFEDNTAVASNNILAGSDSSTITGWTTIYTGVELFRAADFSGTAADGSWVVDLNNYTYSQGGIKQTLNTSVGETYNFSFQATTTNTDLRDGTGQVDVNIGADFHTFALENKSSNFNWETYIFSYTATSLTTDLVFSNQTNSFSHFSYIDAITTIADSATPVTNVPEPTPIALYGVALITLFVSRRLNKVATTK